MSDDADTAYEQNAIHEQANLANSGNSYKSKTVNTCLHCGMSNDRRFEGYATCQDCSQMVLDLSIGGDK